MCQLRLTYGCQHTSLLDAACPLMMKDRIPTIGDRLARRLRRYRKVDDADYVCPTVRGHVQVRRECPGCGGGEHALFVRDIEPLPHRVPPAWTGKWRAATVCEWYHSFFADNLHPAGTSDCCENTVLCPFLEKHGPRPCPWCLNFEVPSDEIYYCNRCPDDDTCQDDYNECPRYISEDMRSLSLKDLRDQGKKERRFHLQQLSSAFRSTKESKKGSKK